MRRHVRRSYEEALKIALSWAEYGVPPCPIAISWDPEKGSTRKRPLTDHGHKDATTDTAKLVSLFEAAPDRLKDGEVLAAGLWLGPAGFLNLDVDVKGDARGDENLAKLEVELGPLPRTPRVNTASGGEHIWLRKDADVFVGNADLAPGVEIRADAGWVVAPGTRTPWGNWEFEDPADDPRTGAKVADWPAWIADRLVGGNGQHGRAGDWEMVEDTGLHPADKAALDALRDLGGHSEYAANGHVCITRPGKTAGASASIGFIGPGIVKVFTPNWPPLRGDAVYDADELKAIADAPTAPNGHIKDSEQAWDDPVPLVGNALPPSFPADAFPEILCMYVVQLARETQTPTDLPGCMVLAVLGAAAGGRAIVEARAGWREPTNIFVAIAMAPGNRKSRVVRAATAPLRAAEQMAVENSVEAITEAQVQRQIADGRATNAARAAVQAAEGGDDAEELERKAADAAAMAEAITVPVTPRFLVDDATPEAVASLLATQGGRLALISAEGGGPFDMMAGRYGKFPNLDVYLKGHAGDQLRVDRKNRTPEFVDQPALTVGVTFQPGILPKLAEREGFLTRGLLARFLFAVPTSRVGYRQIGAAPVDPSVANAYEELVQDVVASLAEWTDPCVLLYSPKANERLIAFEREIEPRLAPDGDLAPIADWGAKLAGAVVRISGLLHLAANPASSFRQVICAETFENAKRIGEYLLAHAIAAHERMGADPAIGNAEALLRWIEANGETSFSRREAHRENPARFPRSTDLDPALALLDRHGWIRRRPDPPSGPRGGRPPSPVYDVNPAACTLRR